MYLRTGVIKMPEPRIICPKCNTSMKLTASLVAPLKARKQVEQQLAEKEQEFAKREVNLRKEGDRRSATSYGY